MKELRKIIGSSVSVWSRIIGFVLSTAIHVSSGGSVSFYWWSSLLDK